MELPSAVNIFYQHDCVYYVCPNCRDLIPVEDVLADMAVVVDKPNGPHVVHKKCPKRAA